MYIYLEIPAVKLKKSGISRNDQEKNLLNFRKSLFLAFFGHFWPFPRGVKQFHVICKGKALFCPKFP